MTLGHANAIFQEVEAVITGEVEKLVRLQTPPTVLPDSAATADKAGLSGQRSGELATRILLWNLLRLTCSKERMW